MSSITTLSDLVDRLIITSLKLWFAQEKLQVAAQTNRPLEKHVAKQLVELNRQRALLKNEIDALAASGKFTTMETIKL